MNNQMNDLLPRSFAGIDARFVGGEEPESEGGFVLICLGIIGITIVDVVFEVIVNLVLVKRKRKKVDRRGF